MNGFKLDITGTLKKFKRVLPQQPVYEAITNSIEANATNIVLTFTNYYDEVDGVFQKYNGFTIEDNGDGFNDENFDSFFKFNSTLKAELGCKGVGRFTWLKVYKNIKITSEIADKRIEISFSKNFDYKKDITIIEEEHNANKTIIEFSNVVDVHNALDFDIIKLREEIFEHLLSKFFLLNKIGKMPSITLIDGDISTTISAGDIPKLKQSDFKAESGLVSYDFSIFYSFHSDTKNKVEVIYCGNGRAIENKSSIYSHIKLPDNNSALFLIISSYLDERVNDERNGFTIDKRSKSSKNDDPISYEEMTEKIRNEIENIIINECPKLIIENKLNVMSVIDENPHLAKYIDLDQSIIKVKDELISNAEKLFEKEKKNIKKSAERYIKRLNPEIIDTEDFLKNINALNEISNLELAQYIVYRQQIIDALSKLDFNNEKCEKLFHNLFMKMGTKADNSLESRINNNIWLLDDKFMTYDRAFSDTKIESIKNEISVELERIGLTRNRPDIVVYFSKNPKSKEAVVVELKSSGTTSTHKASISQEIGINMATVARNLDNLNAIYGFGITNIDSKTEEILKATPGSVEMYSNGESPIFYFYHNKILDSNKRNISGHIFILSYDSICKDANSRNKLFIDLIKQTRT